MKDGALISTADPSNKLINVREHIPGLDHFSYDVAIFIGHRLGKNPTLLPEGVNMCLMLSLVDLQSGIDGFTGQRLPSSIAGMPPMLYAIFRAICWPKLVKMAFDPKDAESLSAIAAELDRREKENS